MPLSLKSIGRILIDSVSAAALRPRAKLEVTVRSEVTLGDLVGISRRREKFSVANPRCRHDFLSQLHSLERGVPNPELADWALPARGGHFSCWSEVMGWLIGVTALTGSSPAVSKELDHPRRIESCGPPTAITTSSSLLNQGNYKVDSELRFAAVIWLLNTFFE